MATGFPKVPTEVTKRADNNSEKTVLLMRRIHQLLALAADPAFDGTIGFELSVKRGSYGRPKYLLVEFDRDAKPLDN